MSTVSGVFPNAITPTFAPSSDPAEQARLRRQNESAVFSPIEQLEENAEPRRTNIEQPGRLEAELATEAANLAVTALENQDAIDTTEETQELAEVVRSNTQETQDAESLRQAEAQAQQEILTRREEAELQDDIALIRELAARDREVRNHEQAHQTVGGEYAGAAQFSYQLGPDGKQYATGGEVPIEISRENDPSATIEKAEQVRRAALAPAEPSAQDQRVAAVATQLMIEAQAELRAIERQEASQTEDERDEQAELRAEETERTEQSSEDESVKDEEASADNAERLNDILEQTAKTVAAALEAAYQSQSAQDIGFNLDTTV